MNGVKRLAFLGMAKPEGDHHEVSGKTGVRFSGFSASFLLASAVKGWFGITCF
jgi:hypothetical protein